MHSKLSQKILQKIQKDGIRPLPKWWFYSLRIIILCLLGIAGIFSSFFATFFLQDLWEYLQIIPSDITWRHLIGILVWGGFGIFFFCVSAGVYTKTPIGYRYTYKEIFLKGALLLALLIVIFRGTGIGPEIHKNFLSFFPEIGKYLYKNSIWNDKSIGRISGQILSVQKDTLTLLSLDDEIWEISTKNALFSEKVLLEKGIYIRISGESDFVKSLNAKRIQPWFGGGSQKKRKLFE